MKASASVLGMVQATKPRPRHRTQDSQLVEIRPDSVPYSAIARFSARLRIDPAVLLGVIGIPERTSIRRKAEGFLKPDEADRLLRIGRVFEEATRILGNEERAAGWLSQPHPILYGVTPLSLLDSDAGTQAVSDELGRIDYGDFA
jgi:putative toxin-antitoxin system antitoxin component (TIGR02293 family)